MKIKWLHGRLNGVDELSLKNPTGKRLTDGHISHGWTVTHDRLSSTLHYNPDTPCCILANPMFGWIAASPSPPANLAHWQLISRQQQAQVRVLIFLPWSLTACDTDVRTLRRQETGISGDKELASTLKQPLSRRFLRSFERTGVGNCRS